jgi:hypothetical protein
VRDTVYLGDVVKYHVTLDDVQPEVELVVKTLATGASELIGGDAAVLVSWDRGDVQIISE